MTMTMEDADEPARRAFTSQRLTLDYVDWGNADAPTLLLVHGGRDHARSWDAVARGMRDRWHVVAPDLRGHGDSAWSPDGAYASPYLLADIAALVDHLGVADVAIVAHSLGAAIALRYAAVFPERVSRIAAIEGIGLAGGDMPASVAERWRAFAEGRLALSRSVARRYPTLDDAVARMREENGFLTPALARHLTVHGTVRTDDGSYRWKFDPYVRSVYPVDLSNEDQRALWRAIACPVWLVHGARSWARHPSDEGRADEFRDARVTSFDDAGHWPHHDRAAAFIAELRDFLSGG